MIKLKSLLLEDEDEPINVDKLYWDSSYLERVAEMYGYNYDFNKLFWSHPTFLYHCTTPEKYELIKSSGELQRQNLTRGINNRSVGHSIFTTMESDEIVSLSRSYGQIVIVINTKQMKLDGFTPRVSKEPEVENAEMLAYVLGKLNNDDIELSRLIDSSGGISEYTVIIYENIPIKYLSLYD